MLLNMNNLRKQAVQSYNNVVQYLIDSQKNNRISEFDIQEMAETINDLGQILGIFCCISEDGNELFTELEEEIKFWDING